MQYVRRKLQRSWYRIPEITFVDYAYCCKSIFHALETHHTVTAEDSFIKAVAIGHSNMTEHEWYVSERIRLMQKVLEMKMGDFHEELMGKFPGYETYPNGHITGCDFGKKDGSEVFEVKNRHNTIKGSDAKHILAMLTKHHENGKKAILVQVNCPQDKVNRFGAPSYIHVWNGKQTYIYFNISYPATND